MAHPALKQDSVAVITGGAAGIGLAIGRRFAALGMAVVIADVRQDALEEATAQIGQAGARDVLAQRTDVSDRDSLSALERERSGRASAARISLSTMPASSREAKCSALPSGGSKSLA